MTGSGKDSRGTALERLIGELSATFFMRDFVFLNPTYSSNGQKRQVTDLLFLLNQDCMVVSVKGTDGEEKTGARLPLWTMKKSREASKNAKTASQRIGKLDVTATNMWGETRIFPAGTLRPTCGLGIVECSQELFRPIEFEYKIPTVSVCPIHYISANDFLNVLNWLGGISDVFNYFKVRQQVLHSFNGINQEQPFLCYYTLRSREDGLGFLNEDKEELRKLHQWFLLDKLPSYGERDRLASYVNAVVHQLHERHPEFESYAPPELKHMIEPSEKRSAYLGMAAMLNSLPMSNKSWIGRGIENGIKRAKETRQSSCFLYKQLLGTVVFVFAVFTEFNRTDKMRALNRFLPAAQYSTSINESLGVAYDADAENMGFEVFWRRGPVEDSDSVRELAARLFSAPFETQCPTPFGEPRRYTPKSRRTGT
ncbi:MAG: hypothetical protein WAN65_16635 [Candidatus Sulfotelmatobacter sp.]